MPALHPSRDTLPLDIHIGGRLRLARMMRGCNQIQLGQAIGVAGQQVQKYERGRNRIGAGRLLVMARFLKVPVTFFYDEIPADLGTIHEPDFPTEHSRLVLNVIRTLERIADPHQRGAVLRVARSLADAGTMAAAAE